MNNSKRNPFGHDTRPIPRSAAQAKAQKCRHLNSVIVRAGHGTETIHCNTCLSYVTKEV